MRNWVLRFYLPLAISLIVIPFIGIMIVRTTMSDTVNEGAQNTMRGLLVLLSRNLQTELQSQWAQTLIEYDALFPFKIHMVQTSALNKVLDPASWEILQKGEVVAIDSGTQLYMKMANSQYALSVGPVNYLFLLPGAYFPYPTRLRVAFLIVVYLLFSGAAFLYLRPIQRDSRDLIGKMSDWDDRPALIRSGLLRPLADAVANMMRRVDRHMGAQSVLFRALSHELRTPIARLSFSLENLRASSCRFDANEFESRIASMQADVDSLDKFVNAILSYARYEVFTRPLNVSPVNLPVWIKAQIQKELPDMASNVVLRMNAAQSRVGAEFDAELLGIALRNALRNARRYMHETIRVDVNVSAQEIGIRIEDDGPGIPERERQRVFEPFVRLEDDRGEKPTGFGLGLPVLARIAEWHGGDVRIGTSALGGAAVELRVPRFVKTRNPNNKLRT